MTVCQEQRNNNNYKAREENPFIRFIPGKQQIQKNSTHMAGRINPEFIFGKPIKRAAGAVKHRWISEGSQDNENPPHKQKNATKKENERNLTVFFFVNYINPYYKRGEQAKKVIKKREVNQRNIIKNQIGKHWQCFALGHIVMKIAL
jgi:hypothetical protein